MKVPFGVVVWDHLEEIFKTLDYSRKSLGFLAIGDEANFRMFILKNQLE